MQPSAAHGAQEPPYTVWEQKGKDLHIFAQYLVVLMS